MHKKFKKNRVFPNDWSNLSQEQALENIQYLLENYNKCNIVFYGDDRLRIGNIYIHRKEVQILEYRYTVYEINRRLFTVDGEVGCYISKLIYCCHHPEKEKNLIEKLEEFLKRRKLDIIFVLVLVCAAMVCIATMRVIEKSKKQKQQEQFEKIVNVKNKQMEILRATGITNQK